MHETKILYLLMSQERSLLQSISPKIWAFIAVYVAILLWWLSLNGFLFTPAQQDTLQNYVFGAIIGILPIVGGLIGARAGLRWGGVKSAMGKALLFLSSGLITWGIGTLIFAYYNIFSGVEVPFPSWADAAYIVSWPLWMLGAVSLSKASGVQFSLKKKNGQIFLMIIPVLVAFFSYYFQVVVARGGVLSASGGMGSVFFDLAYPIGDIVILTIAVLVFGLSSKYLGGRFKIPIWLVLFGFVLNYFADFSFAWTTTNETFFVGGWVDLLFVTTMWVLSLGVIMLDPGTLKE